jgi:Uma2 family endonuclease
MVTQLLNESEAKTNQEQLLALHGLTWQQFKGIQQSLSDLSQNIRLSYLRGNLEIMTLNEPHEAIVSAFKALLAFYCVENGLELYDTGSTTREKLETEVSLQPDTSYFIGGTEGKDYPDLAIEVIFTSGNIKKLQQYKEIGIKEVWFWKNEKLSLYRLRGDGYEQIAQSHFFPELDIDLLLRCTLIHLYEKSITRAINEFRKGISISKQAIL